MPAKRQSYWNRLVLRFLKQLCQEYSYIPAALALDKGPFDGIPGLHFHLIYAPSAEQCGRWSVQQRKTPALTLCKLSRSTPVSKFEEAAHPVDTNTLTSVNSMVSKRVVGTCTVPLSLGGWYV